MSDMPRQVKEQLEADQRLEAEEIAALAKLEQERTEAEAKANAEPVTAEPTPAAVKPTVDTPPVTHEPPQPVAGQDGELARLQAELERTQGELVRERAAKEASDNRWRTADGILKAKESERDKTIQALQAQMAELLTRQAEAAPKVKPIHKYLTPDERQAIGDGNDAPVELRASLGAVEDAEARLQRQIEAATKAAQEAIRKELEQERVKQAEAAKEAAAQAEADARFNKLLDRVEAAAPGFKAENSTPDSGWVKFLNIVNPKTGEPYRVIANALASVGDDEGIARLWSQYQALNPSGSREAALAAQVKPDQSRSATAPRPPAPPITMAEYERFWNLKRQPGALRNKDGSAMTAEQIAAYEARLEAWFSKETGSG